MDKNKFTRHLRKVALPLMAILLTGGSYWALKTFQPTPKEKTYSPQKPRVFTMISQQETLALSILSHGEAQPEKELSLKNLVEGEIIYVSPQFVSGGHFNKGDLLIKIDPEKYQLTVVQKQAKVALAEQNIARAEAQSRAATTELEALGRVQASDLAKGIPQLAHAKSALKAAEAELLLAKRELRQTNIYAPFTGKVVSENITEGFFATRNQTLAAIFSTDIAEIKLALTLAELATLGIPVDFISEYQASPYPVSIHSDLVDQSHHWEGKIVRTEGIINPRTRTIIAVAQVIKPYAQRSNSMPLTKGLFVNATITGQKIERVTRLPINTLRSNKKIWRVNAENMLEVLDAHIIQRKHREVLVKNIPNNSEIITSSLAIPIPGMRVKTIASQKLHISDNKKRNAKKRKMNKITHPQSTRKNSSLPIKKVSS